jgi:hypothetical protein
VTERAHITDEPGALRIEIPARRGPRIVLYLAFLLGFWALGEVAALHALLADPAAGQRLAAAVCLPLWTGLGVAILAACLWLAAGRVVVTATERALTIRCRALGLGTDREYDGAHVQALRLAPAPIFAPKPALGFTLWITPGAGPIALDYGARTVRFGNGLEAPEARRIAARLAERLHVPVDGASDPPGNPDR